MTERRRRPVVIVTGGATELGGALKLVDPATGEVLGDNPAEDQPARTARKGPKR